MYNSIPNRLELWRKVFTLSYMSYEYSYLLQQLNRQDILNMFYSDAKKVVKAIIKELEIVEKVYS